MEIDGKISLRIYIALMLIALLTILAKAQIKIGDITISDSLAKEYFIDCWKHPYIVNSYTLPPTLNDFQWYQDDKGNKCHDINNDEVCYNYNRKWRLVHVRTPNVDDFAQWMRKQKVK